MKTRIAPTYLVWLYDQNKTLILYFENFFSQKGIVKTQLYSDSMRIAIDNLLFDDTTDLFNSIAVERLCRRLYGVEIALKDVTNQNSLNKAGRSISDELVNNVEGNGFAPEQVLEEVRKRLERRANVNKWVAKSKERETPKGGKSD